MKSVTKRQFMRKPGILAGLQPGESVKIDGRPPLVVSRPKLRRHTPKEMEAELDKLAAKHKFPKIDTLALLRDLRQ